MSKSEVIQLLHEYRADLMRTRYPDNDEGDYLIRERDASLRRIARAISGHEADRAADKARIAELEAVLKYANGCFEMAEHEGMTAAIDECGCRQVKDIWRRRILYAASTINAALAQQGKEGET